MSNGEHVPSMVLDFLDDIYRPIIKSDRLTDNVMNIVENFPQACLNHMDALANCVHASDIDELYEKLEKALIGKSNTTSNQPSPMG